MPLDSAKPEPKLKPQPPHWGSDPRFPNPNIQYAQPPGCQSWTFPSSQFPQQPAGYYQSFKHPQQAGAHQSSTQPQSSSDPTQQLLLRELDNRFVLFRQWRSQIDAAVKSQDQKLRALQEMIEEAGRELSQTIQSKEQKGKEDMEERLHKMEKELVELRAQLVSSVEKENKKRKAAPEIRRVRRSKRKRN